MGASRSTLYGYFSGDDDLVRAVIERSWRSAQWPVATQFSDWRPYLEAVVWAVWDHVSDRPGLAAAMGAVRSDASPLIPVDPAIISALLDFGLAPNVAMLAMDVLSDLTSQTFFQDRVADSPVDSARESLRANAMSNYADSLPSPARDAFLEMVAGDPREHFARKLRVVLDGVAALAD